MKVFLSHSKSDETVARKVASALQDAGMEVWDHHIEILPGDNWAEKIARALRESEAMVVLLSPDALRSEWLHKEIEYALGEKRYSNRLIPVLIPPPETFSQENIPWILKKLNMIELSKYEDDEGIKQITQAILKAA